MAEFSIEKDNLFLCKKWLILAVVALSFSGLLSIFIILLRIPFLNHLINGNDIFGSALVIHVNLSVLVWNLSMISLMWSMIVKFRCPIHITDIIWWLSLIATCFIGCSIFFSETESIKNNYIPILHSFIFLLGLGIFATAIFFNSVITILFSSIRNSYELGIYFTALFILISFICFVLAYITIPDGIDLYHFYEYLFWGGGHVMQFAYTQAFIVVYMMILNIKKSKFFDFCFLINFFLILPTIIIYFLYPVHDSILIDFFTLHMKFIGGLLPLIIVCYGIKKLFRSKNIALFWSVFLFLLGGFLGINVNGIHATNVPAHYHGSIVGITISLMGLSYFLLPKFNLKKVSAKLANLQISIYGTGQFLHISGLAWMGGYGALRKTPGVELPLGANIAKAIFIIGGMVAVIAGLMFVLLMINSFLQRRNHILV
ncbi:MAG: cbb3-type cytochrome c oxidase subunit I [Rickettsiaceae bacterium H1]|nr:cbb3-type cytochrome c oxidase subunit I [Rickettsiaceae bacterium H1]